jgi:hypothetical protein
MGELDEEKLQLMISAAVYSGITKSMANGLGAKVREIARAEAAILVEALTNNLANIQRERDKSDQLEKKVFNLKTAIAILALSAVGGSVGGVAAVHQAVKVLIPA